MVSTVTEEATTTTNGNAALSNGTSRSGGGTGSLLEFSSQLTIQSSKPQDTAAAVVAFAYSEGGYVAYQSTNPDSAYIVIRVPAQVYQKTLLTVETLGKVLGLTSNSNDVRVQYTDLNATLESLRTEQHALLKLLNQTTSVNSTLAIEAQLQGVDQQVNDIESQILQTRTLVAYSTIQVTVSETPRNAPLTVTLAATPKNGMAPLSVTLNAVVKGGTAPYVVNFNFGDSTSDQGPTLIHTFVQTGDFNVSAYVTDQNGSVVSAWTVVHVKSAPAQSGFDSFWGTVTNLFVNVVEGIVEVAVVVLPLAAVGAVIIVPIRRRSRLQKGVRQAQ